jgi:hypothetical protein
MPDHAPTHRLADLGLAAAEPSGGTLFQEDWWLEQASGGRMEQVEVRWDGKVVGRLPFVRQKSKGMTRLLMPAFTRTLGPTFDLPPSGPVRRRENICRVVSEFVANLPPHDRFHQYLEPGDESALAFSLADCTVGQHFTFRVDATQDQEQLWNIMDRNTRRNIRAAAKQHQVIQHADIERFISLSLVDRPVGKNHNDFGAVRRLFAACYTRGQATILAVLNANDRDVASAVLVWDARVLYFWVVARDRAIGGPGANSVLLWEAVKIAQSMGKTFDADSYATTNSARFIMTFALQPVVRPSVGHLSRVGCAFEAFKAIAARKRSLGPAAIM